MTLVARDEQTRMEQAQDRVAAALSRLEKAALRPSVVPGGDHDLIDSLRDEIETLRTDNATLRTANKSVQGQIENSIGRLNLLLES